MVRSFFYLHRQTSLAPEFKRRRDYLGKRARMVTLNEWNGRGCRFSNASVGNKTCLQICVRRSKTWRTAARWSRRHGKSSKPLGTSLQEGNKKHLNNRNEDGERKRQLCRAYVSRIILRTVKFLLDGPEVGDGKPRNNLDFVIDFQMETI